LGFTEDDCEVIQEIKNAAAQGTLVFASAANNTIHEQNSVRFPARMREVFGIFSADRDGNSSSFNPTARYSRENFMFPGEDIEGAWPAHLEDPKSYQHEGRVYKRQTGTSCATPIAAAVAAGVLEFAWQPRNTKISGVEMLKYYEGMRDVFLKMLDKHKPGDGCYHYVKPWKLISTTKLKASIPFILSDIIQRINS